MKKGDLMAALGTRAPGQGRFVVSDAVLGASQGRRHEYNNRMIAMLLDIKKTLPPQRLDVPIPIGDAHTLWRPLEARYR